MFTGIIETLGQVVSLEKKKSNLLITVRSSISKELKPDQSVSHNGVCLTVIRANKTLHTVEAVRETLQRTNLGLLKIGSYINLERAMIANGRFDGHFVQGHVDQQAECIRREDFQGSRKFWFSFQPSNDSLIVEKGSISIDGVSLTVVDAQKKKFSVVVIPFTLQHTCFQYLKKGLPVNLEFDILGKYVSAALVTFKNSPR